MAYSDQLKHPNWQRRRLQVLQAADFSCARCGERDKPLHAHHKIYLRGRLPWDYPDELLECLCDPCHAAAHEDKARLDMQVARHPSSYLPTIARLMDRLGQAMTATNESDRADAMNAVYDELDAIQDFERGPGLAKLEEVSL